MTSGFFQATRLASISFVEVFPHEPVIPTTGFSKRSLWNLAIVCKAFRASLTTSTGTEMSSGLSTITALAPLLTASWAKSHPSRAPFSATNAKSFSIFLLSVEKPRISVFLAESEGIFHSPPVQSFKSSNL